MSDRPKIVDSSRERKQSPVYAVLGTAGWPGGIEPWPQTPEHVVAFQREHGGKIRRQFRTPWEDMTPQEVLAEQSREKRA